MVKNLTIILFFKLILDPYPWEVFFENKNKNAYLF